MEKKIPQKNVDGAVSCQQDHQTDLAYIMVNENENNSFVDGYV